MEGENSSESTLSSVTNSLISTFNYFFGSTEQPSEHRETYPEADSVHQDEHVTDLNATESTPICKFFLEGKCRFGDDCRNRHPANLAPQTNAKKSRKDKKRPSNEKKEEKKRSMKTALDVIHRIQWDENLPKEYFKIGYIDRFKGVIEEPFSKFTSWCDLANAEMEALAIPQHRIQYFKYKDTKVWDKTQKIDWVFCSAGKGDTSDIVTLMNQIDDRIEESLRKGEYDMCESDPDHSDSDSDDDGIAINIDADATRVHLIPDEERSTHFLAIKITNPDIIAKAKEIQRHIVRQEEALGDCCMKQGLFHITVAMLRLPNYEGIHEAMTLVESLSPVLTEVAKTVKFHLKGLDTFGQRVLYANVIPEPEEEFWMFLSEIKNRIAETSSNVTVTNKFEFTPHMTLLKVSRPISRLRNSKYLPSSLYEDFIDADFGIQVPNNLQLCVIEATTRDDGFYRTLTDIATN